MKNRTISTNKKPAGPFQVEAIKLKFEADEAGNYSLNPEFVCLDDSGNAKTFKINPINLAVSLAKSA